MKRSAASLAVALTLAAGPALACTCGQPPDKPSPPDRPSPASPGTPGSQPGEWHAPALQASPPEDCREVVYRSGERWRICAQQPSR